jgi:hypothetical protein
MMNARQFVETHGVPSIHDRIALCKEWGFKDEQTHTILAAAEYYQKFKAEQFEAELKS